MFERIQEKMISACKIAVYVAIALIPFQNCSKGGNSTNLGGSGSLSTNPALKTAPIPVEVSLNQISFMSCPVAGESTENFDPNAWPFYTLKYGAYDNTNLVNSTNFLFYTAADHIGGIGISKEAVDYLKRSNPNPVPASIQTYIRSSPFTNAHMISSALIMKDRDVNLLSEFAEGFNHLEPLNTTTMMSYLGNAPLVTNVGTQKLSFFPSISSAASRALTGVINYGKTEADLERFVSGLNNHYLAIGLVPTASATEPKSVIQHFVSPDSNVTKRLGAKGYSFNFQFGTKIMTGVTEWDLNPKDYNGATVMPTDLTTSEAQSWLCLSALVVRDADRKAWQTTTDPGAVSGVNLGLNAFVHPQEITNPAYGPLKEYFFTNQTDANNVLASINAAYSTRPPNGGKSGIFYACPSEDPTTMTAQQKDVLKIMRRFLPAEYFDINVSRSCIVPLDKALNTGSKCYASGDENTALFIQYFNSYNGSPGYDCGPGRNECPAYASFCWRLH